MCLPKVGGEDELISVGGYRIGCKNNSRGIGVDELLNDNAHGHVGMRDAHLLSIRYGSMRPQRCPNPLGWFSQLSNRPHRIWGGNTSSLQQQHSQPQQFQVVCHVGQQRMRSPNL